MRIFGRKREPKDEPPPKLLPPPTEGLKDGEVVERNVKATLLQGKQAMSGILHMTDRRLLFEADKGAARWMIVPYDEMTSAGIYPWQHTGFGGPSSRARCLVVETAAGEQVWWDFGDREKEWLPFVQEKIAAHKPAADEDGG
jgi:hypothetical protein